MKIIVYTTNDYPHYKKEVITVCEEKVAKVEYEKIAREITQKIRSGLLQDAEVELRY